MIPVNQPLLNGNEGKYFQESISSGLISSEGLFVERFESGMAAVTGRKHAVAVSNGTNALEIAMAALQLAAGDQIVLPTFTIIFCVAAVLRNPWGYVYSCCYRVKSALQFPDFAYGRFPEMSLYEILRSAHDQHRIRRPQCAQCPDWELGYNQCIEKALAAG